MMLAFGYTANAQQKKAAATPVSQAKTADMSAVKKATIKDITALSEYLQLSDNTLSGLKALFEYKHTILADPNLSQERKDILAENIEMKLKGSLSADEQEKLELNPKLLKQLTH